MISYDDRQADLPLRACVKCGHLFYMRTDVCARCGPGWRRVQEERAPRLDAGGVEMTDP